MSKKIVSKPRLIFSSEKRNCVDFATADRLAEAFEDFEQDEVILMISPLCKIFSSPCIISLQKMDCAVLHGLGGSFCAGFDLEELSTADEENISNALAKLMDRGPMVRLVFTNWLYMILKE